MILVLNLSELVAIIPKYTENKEMAFSILERLLIIEWERVI